MNQNSHKLFSVISLALALFLFQIPSLQARDLLTLEGAPRVIPHNTDKIQNLAQFAVSQHNNKENAMLEFTRVLKAEEQVVAGMSYHITLEANDGGQKKVYEAQVWVKPWMNFKQLEEFNRVEGTSSCPPADHGMEQGWITVPIHDSGVKYAAEQAIKAIQLRSNSLFPYELLDVISAKSKAIGNNNRYDLLLKVRRGDKEEKFRVQVNKSDDGKFILCSMEQVPSKI